MLRNYTAYFEVIFYAVDTDENSKEAGFCPANSFGEAMDYIEEFYGKDLVEVCHLELLDTSMLVMAPEVAKQVLAEV